MRFSDYFRPVLTGSCVNVFQADLMEQDVSLMSQMLKLNDKIEEFKAHASNLQYRNCRQGFGSSVSMIEASDSEFSDTDDSRLDIFNASTGSYHIKKLKTLHYMESSRLRPSEVTEEDSEATEVETDVEEPRKLARAGSDIIVYRKKRKQRKHRKEKKASEAEDGSGESGSESDTSVAQSTDTESTLSGNSDSTKAAGSDRDDDAFDEEEDVPDSGIQSHKTTQQPHEPPKPRKGGISQNTNFFNFLKANGARTGNPLSGPMLTQQGHNISLEKYFVPQGLVYLKHANAENVFCQFTK